MYTLSEKRAISRRLADVSKIEVFRALLRNQRSPAAGRKMIDKEELAVSLCYELLAFHTEEELNALLTSGANAATVATKAAVAQTAPDSVKKKSQNLNSIRTSTGGIWKTVKSGLQTAYSQTESIFGTGLENLKKTLTVRKRRQ